MADDNGGSSGDNGSGRTSGGRFGAGNGFSKGRPPTSITRELRRIAEPEKIARYLHDLATGAIPHTESDRKWAVEMILNRLEGKPVARSVHLRATAASLLPAHFRFLSPEDQSGALDDLRRRGLAGEIPLLGDGSDDE